MLHFRKEAEGVLGYFRDVMFDIRPSILSKGGGGVPGFPFFWHWYFIQEFKEPPWLLQIVASLNGPLPSVFRTPSDRDSSMPIGPYLLKMGMASPV